MVMLEISRDAAVLVSPGGRLRLLAPRDTPLPASKKLMSLDDQRSYVYLPGYKVTHDLGPNTQAPTLLFRGPLDGTNWEELHDDLCKTESRARNRCCSSPLCKCHTRTSCTPALNTRFPEASQQRLAL